MNLIKKSEKYWYCSGGVKCFVAAVIAFLYEFLLFNLSVLLGIGHKVNRNGEQQVLK